MPPPAEELIPRLLLGPALRTQPDRRLVKLVRNGYENAFEEIVRRYGEPLRRYARAIVGGHAEDVTQDAFSKALLAMRRDDAEIELRPWLYRIVRNTALNDLRDRPPSPQALEAAIAGGRSAAEEVEQREEIAELMARLRALPEPQRAAIVMRELEGLGHEEIAAALGMSGGAARQAIYRGAAGAAQRPRVAAAAAAAESAARGRDGRGGDGRGSGSRRRRHRGEGDGGDCSHRRHGRHRCRAERAARGRGLALDDSGSGSGDRQRAVQLSAAGSRRH